MHNGIVHTLVTIFFHSYFRGIEAKFVTLVRGEGKGEAAWLSVKVGDLNAGDPGSNPRLRLLNEFVLGDPRGKFTTLCK